MERQHKELERVLTEQIQRLQIDRENELGKIEGKSTADNSVPFFWSLIL